MVNNLTIDGNKIPSFGSRPYKTKFEIMCGKLIPFFSMSLYGV
jgi:hypothetical protein